MRYYTIVACITYLRLEGWIDSFGTTFSWWFEAEYLDKVDGFVGATAMRIPVQVGHDKRYVAFYPGLKDGWDDTPVGKMLAAMIMKAALRYTKSAVELERRFRRIGLLDILDHGKTDHHAIRVHVSEWEFAVGDIAPSVVTAHVERFKCVACVSTAAYTELDMHLFDTIDVKRSYVSLFASEETIDILMALPQSERDSIAVLFDRYHGVPFYSK